MNDIDSSQLGGGATLPKLPNWGGGGGKLPQRPPVSVSLLENVCEVGGTITIFSLFLSRGVVLRTLLVGLKGFNRVLTNTKFGFFFGFWKFCSESRFSAF